LRRTLVFAVVVLSMTSFHSANPRVAVDKGDTSSLSFQLLESGVRTSLGRPVSPTVRTKPSPSPTPTATAVAPLATPTEVPTPLVTRPKVAPTAVAIGNPGQLIGTFRISFYTCAENSGCRADWPTSSTIATDPTRIPRGSCVTIDGIGQKIVADAGGAVKGDLIDVFLPQQPGESLSQVHARALALGIQYLSVYWC
jgi:3D (Asp-Asp-Asp) domain-containing protein